MTEIVLATSNPHKIEEVAAVLPADRVRLRSLTDAGLQHLPEPVEDADTFEGNALIKARFYAESGLTCIADDSGLVVDALDGAPGVYSARYAGHDGPRAERDLANNTKLLTELSGVPAPERRARFVCALAYVDPNAAVEWVVHGTFEGSILTPNQAADPDRPERGRGGNGFGYDPLFLVAGDPENRTSAELSPDEKNALSHRGDAVRKLWARLVRPAD